jgi:hypothetical protein
VESFSNLPPKRAKINVTGIFNKFVIEFFNVGNLWHSPGLNVEPHCLLPKPFRHFQIILTLKIYTFRLSKKKITPRLMEINAALALPHKILVQSAERVVVDSFTFLFSYS